MALVHIIQGIQNKYTQYQSATLLRARSNSYFTVNAQKSGI